MKMNIHKSPINRRRRIQASIDISYDTVLSRFLAYCEEGTISSTDLGICISKWLSDDDFYDFVRANYYEEVFIEEIDDEY